MPQNKTLDEFIADETSFFIPSHMELINIPNEDMHLLARGLAKQVRHLKQSYQNAIKRAHEKFNK